VKVLLDESVHVDFRLLLVGHDVFTVTFLGWKGTKNGALVARAVSEGFDAIVTHDQGMVSQINLHGQPIAITILHAASNAIQDVRPLVPALLKELNHITPGTFAHVRA
jgi:predicted nuclease of predicted toxin-antitoxin system